MYKLTPEEIKEIKADEQLREGIWFICQNIRTEGLSETEATDQILPLIKAKEQEMRKKERENSIRKIQGCILYGGNENSGLINKGLEMACQALKGEGK